MPLLCRPLLAAARSEAARGLVESVPGLVGRYVAGADVADALEVAAGLVEAGMAVTVDVLGEDTRDRSAAEAASLEYLTLLDRIRARDLTRDVEVSVKLSALGLGLRDGTGPRVALEHARRICRAAHNAGTTVTVDMEDHTTTEATLDLVRELRQDFPATGVAVQSQLLRTERDCRALAMPGSRVRLCKGAYDAPAAIAHRRRVDVDRAFLRCLRILLEGGATPMIASHDPTILGICEVLVDRYGLRPGEYEFQMLHGVRTDEQRRLAETGETMRVYLPYGEQWYGYLMRRLAERPQNLALLARSLVSHR
ncbi:proline dehydrogenase family protein [Nocardioides limicola]|uniref:proline dehydrogenase family protein n=1 Tax=Nocardioides limicola TaxID=2803368 RepID=UPI001EF05CCF|nr:proline dehydrogenase family protein [Nocardioides sp. DJM-14]